MSTHRDFASLFSDLWEQVLAKVPPDTLYTLQTDMSAAGGRLGTGQVPSFVDLPDDEQRARGCELALLNFLTQELTRQLCFKDDDGEVRVRSTDTVLHEHGIRHNIYGCAHCEDTVRFLARKGMPRGESLPMQLLIKEIEHLENVAASDELQPKLIYELVFTAKKKSIDPLLSRCGLTCEWMDPDMDYLDDVRAYVSALTVLKEQLQKLPKKEE